jgi:hypothetical protein
MLGASGGDACAQRAAAAGDVGQDGSRVLGGAGDQVGIDPFDVADYIGWRSVAHGVSSEVMRRLRSAGAGNVASCGEGEARGGAGSAGLLVLSPSGVDQGSSLNRV